MQTVPNAAALADKSLAGKPLSRAEALAVLDWPQDLVPELLAAAHRVRLAHFGRKVKMNYLVNVQSGLCAEDCGYCSQSKDSKAPIDKYRLLSWDKIVKAAEEAVKSKAARLCLVTSGRGPTDKDVAQVAEAVKRVKASHPELEICCCMGLLKDGQAAKLKEAGVNAYNHNLNTSESFYEEICSTHSHQDRVDTVKRAMSEGLSSCSGAIFGLGERKDDIVDVAFRLREMNVDSVPINFLIPIDGTPLAGRDDLTPLECLKILCLFRLVCPKAELRIAGGREVQLRSLQAQGLLVANSIFVGDYLTTKGQSAQEDMAMIRDMGLEVLGEDAATAAPKPRAKDRVAIASHTYK